jgi:hypothetical protein
LSLQRFTDPEAAARDLVQRLARGQFRPAGAWIGSPMGEGDAAWAPIMADLLDQARRAVEQGEARSATRIYALLLPALLLDGAFGGCEDPRALLGEPVATHLLRYLQAISAQHRPAQAGHALVAALIKLAPLGEVAPLDALLRPLDEADRQALAQSLRAALLQAPTESADWDRQRLALLQILPPTPGELRQLQLAVDRGAGRLPELHVELVGALLRAGSLDAVEAAVARALASPALPSPTGLRLRGLRAEAWERQGARDKARAERLDMWMLGQDAERLYLLADRHPEALPEALSAAYGRVADEGLLARLELLAGEHDTALARLQAAPIAAWSVPEHPFPIVLPFLLRLGLGPVSPPMGSVFSSIWLPELPWTLAVEGHLRRQPALAQDGPYFRALGHAELLRALDEGVATGHIPDPLPAYAVAWAEVQHATGATEEALAFLDRLRRRHPRHRRFKTELAALGPRARLPSG